MDRSGLWLVLALAVSASPAEAQEPRLVDTPQLEALRAARRASDPLTAARRAEVAAAIARGGAIATRGAFGLSVELEELQASQPLNHTLTVTAQQEFEPRSQISAERAVAAARLRVAEAHLDAVILSRAVEFERDLLEAVIYSRIRSRLLSEDSMLARAEVTLNVRFASGEARYVDVIRLRTERLSVQGEAAEAGASAAAAVLRLRAYAPVASASDIDAALRSLGQLPLPVLPDSAQVMAQSPVLRAQAARLAIGRAELASTRALSARRWSAGLGLQRFDAPGGYTIGPVLSGSLTLPLPQRASNDARVIAGVLDTVAIASSQRAAELRIATEHAAAHARFAAAHARYVGIDARLLAAAREERESAIASYGAGDLSLLELLDFERSIARADKQILMSYLDMLTAWADAWLAGAHLENGE